ncbi:MAG: hypothetical protein HZA91_07410 [Verrucomicrobia bacterium]|nr:hypothetical protein [Verrucomicrobiota bacterium]
MSSAPSRLASLFWSCASFSLYPRVADSPLGRSVSYLLILACVAALGVAVFFGTQVVPALRAASRVLPELTLAAGQLVVAPNAPTILYDDGAHGMLLVRLAVDQEPPAVERRYDAIITLRGGGVDAELCGRVFHAVWPARWSLVVQPLDAVAFMDSWWMFLCMVVFAGAAAWFFVTRFVHALVGSLLGAIMAGPTRGASFGRAFNLSAYAVTPGTLLMVALLWANAFWHFPPALLQWNWAIYVVTTGICLAGAVSALPKRPWRGPMPPLSALPPDEPAPPPLRANENPWADRGQSPRNNRDRGPWAKG